MRLDVALATEFDQARGEARGVSACAAPLINLHFSQLGVVTACCFNRSFVLGVYPDSSVAQIWEGAGAGELREALAQGDFSKGCGQCWQQLQARDFGGSHAVFYTRQAAILAQRRRQLGLLPDADATTPGPALPLKLEFNIHNACNLQCIMCHGLASSAIRARREGLSAQPNPYDDAFVEQLAPYLPYVIETDFIGGEPFLVPVYRKIWELLRRVNPKTKVCILTNGTILDAGLENLLENINCVLHVSIDSFRKDTYERIRRGASYEQVMAHSEYFRGLMAQRGLPLTWRYCPLRLNWHEIPETVSYCTERGIVLFYNQVDSPIGLALTTLPPAELAKVIDTLEAQEPRLPPSAVGSENLQNYRELMARLKGFLRPEVRTSALRTRLDTARAVVSHYSRTREDAIRERGGAALQDALTQAIKNLLIARLNIEQAAATEALLSSGVRAQVEEAEQILLELRADVSFGEFLGTYLKELIRTYSGVWGVVEVHAHEVFSHVDEFVARLSESGSEGNADWSRVLRPAPGAVYESTALSSSVARLERWFASL
jgi:MoaA/NifB/PqqE/SkfB family radical SAM enzyme